MGVQEGGQSMPVLQGPFAYVVHSDSVPMSNYPSGKWTTGICSCLSDCETCCCTFCCPCIQVGRNIAIISDGRTECATGGLLWFLVQSLTACGCLYTCQYRKQLRQKYVLPQQPCGDFCTHCWCTACAICQEGRELKKRGWDLSAGYGPNMARFRAMGMAPPAQAMMYK